MQGAVLAVLALVGTLALAFVDRIREADAPAATVSVEADAGLLVGIARVTDGDSLRLGEERIRLHGIDAPEARQECRRADGAAWACGEVAGSRLAALADGREVACRTIERDRFGRVVARCAVDGVDLGATLVEEGLAFAYRSFSLDYVAHEERARAARRGIFDGDNMAPWDWRRAQRQR
ncbi:thermonuclease family protein [Salinarimonas sp.]|uniref:thermonuclease family protein n=1 Tax=Salinarimonas sp. TaxID=2766526 RepID=UPI00391B3A47